MNKEKEILNRCIELLDEQQKVELYESFNGGTFDTNSFNEWIEEYVYLEDDFYLCSKCQKSFNLKGLKGVNKMYCEECLKK